MYKFRDEWPDFDEEDGEEEEAVDVEIESECMSITPGAKWNGTYYFVTGVATVPLRFEDEDEDTLAEWATDEVNGCKWKETNHERE